MKIHDMVTHKSGYDILCIKQNYKGIETMNSQKGKKKKTLQREKTANMKRETDSRKRTRGRMRERTIPRIGEAPFQLPGHLYVTKKKNKTPFYQETFMNLILIL